LSGTETLVLVQKACGNEAVNRSQVDMYMSYRSFGLKIQLTVAHDVIAVWTVCYVYHVT